jgi:hypothetical protein
MHVGCCLYIQTKEQAALTHTRQAQTYNGRRVHACKQAKRAGRTMMAGRRPVDVQMQPLSHSGLVSAAPPIESARVTPEGVGGVQVLILLKPLLPQLATTRLGPITTPSAAVKFTVMAPAAQLMSAIAASVHFLVQPVPPLPAMHACGRLGSIDV